MMEKRSDESRHYAQIWDKVIKDLLPVIEDECDNAFSESCDLKMKPPEEFKRSLETEYRTLRRSLKESCYGNREDNGVLDGRKLAAVFCKALINKKAFCYDTSKALGIYEERKKELAPEAFNLWAVHNVFLNYKLAYYVSLQLVYFTLMETLLKLGQTKDAKNLNTLGHLFRYPPEPAADSFDINIIIGLARADFSGKDIDMFMLAMQLYQIEMYTVEKLQNMKQRGE